MNPFKKDRCPNCKAGPEYLKDEIMMEEGEEIEIQRCESCNLWWG